MITSLRKSPWTIRLALLRERTQVGLIHLKGKVRRYWLCHFQKGYVQRQMARREGDCAKCGQCCQLVYECPMLTREKRCLIYGDLRPMACRYFPIDRRDLRDMRIKGVKCGFRFDA